MFSLTQLHPSLQPLYTKLVDDLSAKSIISRGIQGWRDPAYQDQLHFQGISPLTGLTSKHCFTLNGLPASKAFDLGIFNSDGSYAKDGTDVRYTIAGGLWRGYIPDNPDLGLVWGGSWSKPDFDHFQIS